MKLRAGQEPSSRGENGTSKKLLTSILLFKTKFFAPMSTSASNSSLPAELDPTALLEEFPTRRAGHAAFSAPELRAVLALLDAYVASTSKRTAPTKPQLTAAVISLLPPSANSLSSKWSKNQLAYAMRKWIVEAEALGPEHKQYDLFLEVRTSSADPKMLDHTVFILEDDGSVATFSVASPQPIDPPASATEGESSAQVEENAEEPGTENNVHDGALATDLFSPNSIATSASSFVRHLNELVESTEPALAAIETFPHPRVGNSSATNVAPDDQPAVPGSEFLLPAITVVPL